MNASAGDGSPLKFLLSITKLRVLGEQAKEIEDNSSNAAADQLAQTCQIPPLVV